MKKRVFSLLLALVLCVGLSGTAFAEWIIERDEDGNITDIHEPEEKEPEKEPDKEPEKPPVKDPEPSGSDRDDRDDRDERSNITVRSDGAANGRITYSPSNPRAGDTVTVTAKPKDGYQAETIIVKDGRGSTIDVRKVGDNKFTFTMPSGRVTITPVFTLIQAARPENPFTDVAPGAYYTDAVLWAVANGITNGTTATTFSPNKTCTRGQTVTFLWRAAGSPAPTATENPFTDVKPGDYYYNAVLWAVEKGVTKGATAATFAPGATVTRGQTVTFLYRAAGAQAGEKSNPFSDVAAGAYYTDAVLWAVEKGITNGKTATAFVPNEGCTRGQIVTFLYRGQ